MPKFSNPIQVRWLPEALMDLDRLDQFLRPKNARAATLAFQKINAAASTLTENPEIGAIYDDDKNFRQLIIPFGKQAYIMHYRTEGDRIYIVRIWHGREERAVK